VKTPPGDRVRTFDWAGVRRRLARALAAAEAGDRLTPERARALLEERARALARPPAATSDAGVLHLVTFALANERYGIEARHVRAVARLSDYTPVPGAPDFLLGVMNLRGEVLAVVDLRKFLGAAVRGVSDLSRVLVLGADRAEFGILADEAHEVRPLAADAVLDPPASVAGIGREYLLGVTADALIILDGAVLLRDPRLFIDQGEEAGP
jgi:purine-binding chemotaxis protein CheW